MKGLKKKYTKKINADSFEDQTYILKLYITGTTPQSQKALANIKKICEEYLKNRYVLQVIDIYQNPKLAKEEQIIAVPTLIKKLPPPLRRFIGDLSNKAKILKGLDLEIKKREADE